MYSFLKKSVDEVHDERTGVWQSAAYSAYVTTAYDVPFS